MFYVVVLILPGIEVPSFPAVLLATGAMALINALLWPLVIRIVLPLTVLTFGLGSLALNAGAVMLAVELVDGNGISFFDALAAARSCSRYR